ncbi:unnamed protein product [Clonostachys rhizophaga]|uniref:Uncharacterized protein n=1 Tax=Clonostachys rhizophaga TaxID=160324 RepID=A0A9N9V945_9HYPO|nr:unnamed protein product [Clonostachys rhizophaga]
MDSATPDSYLQCLPHETLQQIAGHIADSHPPSLNALALTSKTCHEVATLFNFRQVHLTVRNPKQLEHDVAALVAALSRTESIRHVHSLTLEGFLDMDRPVDKKGTLDWWESTQVREPHINNILPNKEPIPSGFYYIYDKFWELSSEEDTAWAPVIDLIKMLPSIAKIIYNCPNHFPPSLLNALHQNHTQCKIHYLTFRLQTILQHPTYGMTLATSPCLYSVRLLDSWRDSEDTDDFSRGAIMQLVAGLAPNLKEVHFVGFRPNLSNRSRRQRGYWPGLPGFIPGKIGSLTSLSLLGCADLSSPALIRGWAKHTDFGSLHHLALGGEKGGWGLNGVNNEVMGWITHNCSFPQLKTLEVVLVHDHRFPRSEYCDSAASFLGAFNPLCELSVTGPLEVNIFDAILHQHGQTLKKLSLHSLEEVRPGDEALRREMPMVFTKVHVSQIQAHCPALEELAITVKRTQSNAVEVELYRSLAKLERLRSLFLILDCSDLRPFRDSSCDAEFDEDDQRTWLYENIKRGHLRLALMNCAVDETLARSIWETICHDKVSTPLESLKLWTTGVGEFGNGQDVMADFAANMSRSWLVERLPRDDIEVINITELGQYAREARDQSRKEWETRWNKGEPTESEEESRENDDRFATFRVFRRIWPRKEGSGDWREDWSSLPLQV